MYNCIYVTITNVPAKILGNIKALYREPRFRVVGDEDTSGYQIQASGIRQGCPLSPYLFLLVMTAMFADIHERVNPKIYTLHGGVIDGLGFTEILYADDTMLVLKDSKPASKLLHEIETESEYYNLKLNKDKCETILMNNHKKVVFKDGTELPDVDKATYLGGVLET